MRRLNITLLILIMIITSLFVSCDALKTFDDGIAYINMKIKSKQGRDSLSITYENEDYETLYWFYTATKEDKYGTTGETTGETAYKTEDDTPLPGLKLEGGTIGPFSQGVWTFSLYAYKCPAVTDNDGNVTYPYNEQNKTKIYEGKAENVTLLGGETKSVGVTVKGVGNTGSLILSDLYFNSSQAISTVAMEITRTGSNDTSVTESETGAAIENVPALTLTTTTEDGTTKYSIAFSGDTPFTLEKGKYECVVKGFGENSTDPSFTSKTIEFAVYGDLTTTLTGLVSATTGEGN